MGTGCTCTIVALDLISLCWLSFSSGNHGAAVALAAKMRGVAATVVVPQGTPKCKLDAIAGYGGDHHSLTNSAVTLTPSRLDLRGVAGLFVGQLHDCQAAAEFHVWWCWWVQRQSCPV